MDKPVEDLPPGDAPDGTELMHAVQDGNSRQFTSQEIADLAVGSDVVADRTALAAISVLAAGMTRLLIENGREGMFEFVASDLSTKVAADTQQGLYVAPASDTDGSSGAWVRHVEGPVNVLWFGIVEGDASGANGAGNSTKMSALLATIRTRAVNVITNYQGLESVRFPAGYFEFGSTIELTDGTLILEGVDTGHASARATSLKFPAGVTGIRTQRFDTSGASGASGALHRGGDGAIIRNFGLFGGYTATEGDFHGIQLRARATIENVYIQGFEGDGIHGFATAGSGTVEGNANNSVIRRCRIQQCRNGMFIDGADANIWTIQSVDCSGNRRWGFFDRSFLGNTYIACHAATNGLGGASASLGYTVVTNSGNRYGVIAGQEAGASTNAPSGTTADNTWWYFIESGGESPSNNIFEWLSGTTYRAGGSYHTDDANARNWFGGCYHESGQGKAQLVTPTMVLGGMISQNVHGTAVSLFVDAGIASNRYGFRSALTDTTSTREVTLGSGTEKETLLFFKDTVAAPNVYRLKFNGNDLQLDYQNSNSNRPFAISGALTALQLGTGAAAPHFFVSEKFAIGDTQSNARRITNGTVVPSSGAHGTGERVLNRTSALAGIDDWICLAAGTPGTWGANYFYPRADPTTGIGYVTGAGGAQTQATSKAQGVTLNKVTGQITTHNAALAAGASVSFTLTNSAIAATDVVMVSIASGATVDAYLVNVTATAAGSCRIQITNMSAGSLGEALVLNFTVIKGVAA